MQIDKLNYVLKEHKKWIAGKGGSKTDLSGANLSGADLFRADLFRADLSGANLLEANLSGADLFKADLFKADLSKANLSKANLSGANLSGANLFRADLSEANLFGADLSGANLSGARGILSVYFDARGYTLCLCNNGALFKAGCRNFSYDEALYHWGHEHYPNRERGRQYVEAVKFLKNLSERS